MSEEVTATIQLGSHGRLHWSGSRASLERAWMSEKCSSQGWWARLLEQVQSGKKDVKGF